MNTRFELHVCHMTNIIWYYWNEWLFKTESRFNNLAYF